MLSFKVVHSNCLKLAVTVTALWHSIILQSCLHVSAELIMDSVGGKGHSGQTGACRMIDVRIGGLHLTVFLHFLKMTFRQAHPPHAGTGQVCGEERVSRIWTSFLRLSFFHSSHNYFHHFLYEQKGATVWMPLWKSALCETWADISLHLKAWPFGTCHINLLVSSILHL